MYCYIASFSTGSTEEDPSRQYCKIVDSMYRIKSNKQILVSSAHMFANRLNPDQALQNVGIDLDTLCLTLRWYFKKNFSKTLILKNVNRRQKAWNISQGAKSYTLGSKECWKFCSWEQIDRILPNFIYAFIYRIFCTFVSELWPLIYPRILFPLNILKTNWQNFTKFYICIDNNKI